MTASPADNKCEHLNTDTKLKYNYHDSAIGAI